MALAVITPTITPPIRPGPPVAAMPARSPKSEAGLRHDPADQAIEMVEMAAGGDLRHHAAIGPMLGELRQHRLGQHAPVVGDQCRRRLVAARLDAQHDHGSGDRGFASRGQMHPLQISVQLGLSDAAGPRPHDLLGLPVSGMLNLGSWRTPVPCASAPAAALWRWRRRRKYSSASPRRIPICAPAEIAVIRTTGDRVQDRKLAEIGGKGLFTKEIEEALLDGRIDLAVHSMKDMPTLLPPGLVIGCLLPREDPRDALFSPHAASLADLPQGARVGTSSLRRQAQLLALRPDLQVVSSSAAMSTRGWPSSRRARSMPPCWRWRA